MSAQCNLIIDSCCDLPLELVQQEGVQLIDFNYIIDDKTFKDDFYQSVTPKEFYDNIRNGATPSTSQVAPAETEAAFRNAIESGVPTVYLCFSSGLSSNYSTAYAIWSQLKAEYPEAPIYIVDLLIGSTPEGLLVLEALRQRESGLTAEEMVAWAEEARYFVQTLFMVDDLDALHRGGRIPASVAFAGSKLDLKPLLNFDTNGKLSLAGASHGRKKGLKQLASFYEKAHAENSNLATLIRKKTPTGFASCSPNKTIPSRLSSTTSVLPSAVMLVPAWCLSPSGARIAARHFPSLTKLPARCEKGSRSYIKGD